MPATTAVAPRGGWWRALGPAFVAAVAYVDPGNVAANLAAGARHGYLLVWVLVLASAAAAVVQYQSAKLGLVTGRTLSAHVVAELARWPGAPWWRGAFALQAGAVAMATEVAELIGGALALHLLLGLPMWLGGLVVALVSLGILGYLRTRRESVFEGVVIGMLACVALGFMASLVWAPPSPRGVLGGLVPRLAGSDSVMLAASVLGATVMPHAVYLHSRLAIDRHLAGGRRRPLAGLLRLQRVDVTLALMLAGGVNIAMLLFAAAALRGHAAAAEIEGAHAFVASHVSPVAATVFALGLLASGVGSTVVGTHTGSGLLLDLSPRPVSAWARRLLTIGPAMVLLLLHLPPTSLLVWSQAALSLGLPFALVPLALLTGSRRVMGDHVDTAGLRMLSRVLVLGVVVLNLGLLGQLVTGS